MTKSTQYSTCARNSHMDIEDNIIKKKWIFLLQLRFEKFTFHSSFWLIKPSFFVSRVLIRKSSARKRKKILKWKFKYFPIYCVLLKNSYQLGSCVVKKKVKKCVKSIWSRFLIIREFLRNRLVIHLSRGHVLSKFCFAIGTWMWFVILYVEPREKLNHFYLYFKMYYNLLVIILDVIAIWKYKWSSEYFFVVLFNCYLLLLNFSR